MRKPPERRADVRPPGNFNGGLTTHFGQQNVQLTNISAGGCMLQIRNGFTPSVGDAVTIVFMDGTTAKAKVRWLDRSNCGVEFDTPLSDPQDLVHFDHLGADFYPAVVRYQRRTAE